MPKPQLIYLAAPYSGARTERAAQITDMAWRIMTAGSPNMRGPYTARFLVLSPITYGHFGFTARDFWRDNFPWTGYSGQFLLLADLLVVLKLPGWQESVGVGYETEIAEKAGIPIMYLNEDATEAEILVMLKSAGIKPLSLAETERVVMPGDLHGSNNQDD